MELNCRQLKAIRQKKLYVSIIKELQDATHDDTLYFFIFISYATLPKESNERKALDKLYDVVYSNDSVRNIKKQIRAVLEFDKLIDMFYQYFS